MKRSAIVLLSSVSLLLPAAVISAPAEAGDVGGTITNCSKTRHGVKVRILVRDKGRSGMNVRISHRFASGNFKEPRVRSTATGIYREGKAPPPDESGGQIGGGASLEPVGGDYSFRTDPRSFITVITTTFKLRSGKRINLSCRLP